MNPGDQENREVDKSRVLFDQARSGDASSIWRLTERMRPYLKAVVARELSRLPTRAKEDESDVVQQALAAAVLKFYQFEGETLQQWQAWLVAIVRNEARNAVRYWQQDRRACSREMPLEAGAAPAEKAAPHSSLERREQAVELLAAIEQLPKGDQAILRLRNFEDLSYAEIAERLGIGEVAARRRWSNALARLRARLDEADSSG